MVVAGPPYQRASRADRALVAADQDARDQFVILSRTVERREHDRLLHDTVLNTLTAVARSGPAAASSAGASRTWPGWSAR